MTFDEIYVFLVHCERIPRKDKYFVRFNYNEQLVKNIKNLPKETRKWSALNFAWEIKTYSLYLLIKNYKKSKKIHFDFGSDESKNIFIEKINKLKIVEREKRKFIEELNIKKEEWVRYKEELEIKYLDYNERVHSFLKPNIVLYPHQIVAAMFMNATRNTLIAHEMGLGKTLSSICYAEMSGFEKVVVITPNSLKFNFYYEVRKFTTSEAHIINWKKNNCSIDNAKYIILNYEYFNSGDHKKFKAKWDKLDIGKIDCVISDECQRLKTLKTNTVKNFTKTFKKDIFRDGKISKIFLSGTPAPNRAYELYSVLNQISPLDFVTKTHFQEYYCGMTCDSEGWGYVTNSSEAKLEELFHKIAPFTHRKKKEDVLNLPDKIYQRVILEMSDKDMRTYEDIEEGVANEFINEEINNPLTKMIRLRQFTTSLKFKSIIELVENILETGEKVVIVDYFKETLRDLHNKLGDVSALHTGDQTVEERSEIVDRFQDPNSDLKVFLGSIQTSKEGLTLTQASKLFILSLPFSVGEYDQVSDRLHRISQENTVNIYPLIFRDTIDDYVYDSIESKRMEISKVIDNIDYVSTTTDSVMSEVMNKIKEKYGKKLRE